MIRVIEAECRGCQACVSVCPMGAITITGKKAAVSERCVHCRSCIKECKFAALEEIPRADPAFVVCKNCGVKCEIPEGREGACKRFTNRGGVLVRNRPLQIPDSLSPDREKVAISIPLTTAVGAGAAYPDYHPAPYIVEEQVGGFDVITAVTEAPISYSSMMVKIDSNIHLGDEGAAVRCGGKEIGAVSAEQYGSQILILGGVNRVKGPNGMTVVKAMADLGNKRPVTVKIDGGCALELTVGKAPVINGVADTKMRVGCGGACCGLFAKHLGQLVDEAIILDHHVTGLFTRHPAGAEQLPYSGVTPVGRPATPGRYFFEHGEGWGGTNITDPIEAIADIDMTVARPGMKILVAETTWRQIALFEVGEDGKPRPVAIPDDLEAFRRLAAGNCEDSKVSAMYYAGVGGSARAGVTVDPVKLTRAVHAGQAVLSIAGAETFVMPGGGITFLADVEQMVDTPFHYTASPAVVAPIEYTITRENYEKIGGHMQAIRPRREVLEEGRNEMVALRRRTRGGLIMKEAFGSFWEGGKKRQLTGANKTVIGVIAAMMSVYQIVQSTFLAIQPVLHYTIHLTFILVLCYLYYTPRATSRRTRTAIFDFVIAAVMVAAGLYYATQVGRYLLRWPQVDALRGVDIVVGIILCILVIDGTRRTMGMVLPTIAIVFILYTFFGHHLPGFLYHRPILPIDILDQMVFTTNGIFTSPIAVSSTYVFLFCLFGSFFNYSGAGDFFYNFSMALAGKYTGGAGKVSIVSSCLFGMINGSPTANVATTGSFTIPMMKKVGYDTDFSGAVCAVASTGGGIMPPIMGTAAFLMVEMAGIPYKTIAVAAIVPGALYYMALLLMVHFRAKKLGLQGMSREELPDMKETLKKGFQFILPLVVLIVIIMQGYTPSMAAVAGIACVILASYLRRETRMTPRKILRALEDGALQSIVISLSCAIAGMVICGLMTTGLSGKLASLVLSVGGESLIIALIITAVLCILLGMGMPVAAAYALTASLAIPSLYELGVAPMAAHMFVVYFSTMSAITPPVAVASFAAAGIGGGNATRIGWSACLLGSVSFIVPFMFVLQPQLLATPENFALSSVWIILTALIGVYSLSSGIEGWLLRPVNPVVRFLLAGAGLLMIYPETLTDFVGIAVFASLLVVSSVLNKRHKEAVVTVSN